MAVVDLELDLQKLRKFGMASDLGVLVRLGDLRLITEHYRPLLKRWFPDLQPRGYAQEFQVLLLMSEGHYGCISLTKEQGQIHLEEYHEHCDFKVVQVKNTRPFQDRQNTKAGPDFRSMDSRDVGVQGGRRLVRSLQQKLYKSLNSTRCGNAVTAVTLKLRALDPKTGVCVVHVKLGNQPPYLTSGPYKSLYDLVLAGRSAKLTTDLDSSIRKLRELLEKQQLQAEARKAHREDLKQLKAVIDVKTAQEIAQEAQVDMSSWPAQLEVGDYINKAVKEKRLSVSQSEALKTSLKSVVMKHRMTTNTAMSKEERRKYAIVWLLQRSPATISPSYVGKPYGYVSPEDTELFWQKYYGKFVKN
jgi:hypothetical protein